MNLKPSDGFPYYYHLAGGLSCQELFTSDSTFQFLKTIDEERSKYRYDKHKWSIKEIVVHITDHERIKMHRAFLLSRKQSVELWGYDQNSLVENSRFGEMTFEQLVLDLKNVRQASISFLDGLSEAQLRLKGRANEFEITLEEFLKSIIGHEIHHINSIKDKYLKK